MMRTILAGAVAVVLCSCSDSASNETAQKELDIVALLQANDPKVCATEAVQRTVLQTANDAYESYLERGGPSIKFDLVSAVAIEPNIHEITCSATVALAAPLVAGSALETMMADDSPLAINYKVRPSLDPKYDFIVDANPAQLLGARIQTTIWQWQREQREPRGNEAANPSAQDSSVRSENNTGTTSNLESGLAEPGELPRNSESPIATDPVVNQQ